MMRGKTVVITGATSGLGEVAAVELARQGARIIMVARDAARMDASLAKVRAAGPGVEHKGYLANFASIADMKRVGVEIAAAEPRIDVLANNAGAMLSQRVTTEDGLELTFAANHIAPFVLTNALLPSLKPGARIINTASTAHAFVRKLDFDDLDSKRDGVMAAYGLSKLCNILHANELARRLAGAGVVANSFHPGVVKTRFGQGIGFMSTVIGAVNNFIAITPAQGADTLLWLATSDAGGRETGGYFDRRKRVTPSPAARSEENARRLWDISEALEARV